MSSAELVTPGSGAMFDRIAKRYDLLNRINSFGLDESWRRRAVEALRVEPGDRVLDLATGTGDIALRIARRFDDVTVTGVDPSLEMIAVGREKVAAAGLDTRVELREGDAQSLVFEDRSFAGVTMAFGIRNVPDRKRALAEMRRVLKPGGRLAILELATPDRSLLAAPARWYIGNVVPTMGALLSGSKEYKYLERSIAAFPSAEVFAETIESVGLKMVSIERLTFGSCVLFVAERSRT